MARARRAARRSGAHRNSTIQMTRNNPTATPRRPRSKAVDAIAAVLTGLTSDSPGFIPPQLARVEGGWWQSRRSLDAGSWFFLSQGCFASPFPQLFAPAPAGGNVPSARIGYNLIL